jgi:hypothetical protein
MDYMEDGTDRDTSDTEAGVGSSRTTRYHHVMGSDTKDGDEAVGGTDSGNFTSYPTSTTDVYCVSCHVDHDKFNSAKAANLRPDITDTTPGGIATDYDSTTDSGVCTGCHTTSLTKDTASQLDDGSTATPKVLAGPGQFGASAHDYYALSSYGASTFSANCSKCHEDGQTKEFQTSSLEFGTHWSLVRRILSLLGGTTTDLLQQQHCYGCHSEVGDGWKSTEDRDFYNRASMTDASEDAYDQFQLSGSTHPVVATANGSVECESCHNVHVVTSTTGKVTDPNNTYSVLAYGTTAEQATYCLRCHDGTQPSRTVNDTIYVPYSVTIVAGDATIMNKNGYAARGHWTVNGAIDSSEVKSCAVCHDNHGSVAPKLLGVRTATANTINGASITANDTTVCRACHTSASTGFPYFTKAANDYPNTGTWPSWATYSNGTYGIHRALDPGTGIGSSLPDYAAGDCKICHDVHGTSNPYDGLRPVMGDATPSVSGSYVTGDYSLCFDCHDSTGPATDNIAQYYPASSGGTASSTTSRYGHKTVEEGTLPAGSSLPCWDCHNPHGSSNTYGLQIITQTSSSNTISVTNFSTTPGTAYSSSSAAQVRAMCFTCHIPADTNNGWNGSAYAAVSAGARFEGLDRLTQLKISTRMPHNQGNANSCYNGACHPNVHYPE